MREIQQNTLKNNQKTSNIKKGRPVKKKISKEHHTDLTEVLDQSLDQKKMPHLEIKQSLEDEKQQPSIALPIIHSLITYFEKILIPKGLLFTKADRLDFRQKNKDNKVVWKQKDDWIENEELEKIRNFISEHKLEFISNQEKEGLIQLCKNSTFIMTSECTKDIYLMIVQIWKMKKNNTELKNLIKLQEQILSKESRFMFMTFKFTNKYTIPEALLKKEIKNLLLRTLKTVSDTIQKFKTE